MCLNLTKLQSKNKNTTADPVCIWPTQPAPRWLVVCFSLVRLSARLGVILPHSCQNGLMQLSFPDSFDRTRAERALLRWGNVLLVWLSFSAQSCQGRCGEAFKRGQLCDCDPQCIHYNTCCQDYQRHCCKGHSLPYTNTIIDSVLECDFATHLKISNEAFRHLNMDILIWMICPQMAVCQVHSPGLSSLWGPHLQVRSIATFTLKLVITVPGIDTEMWKKHF